MIAAQLSGKVQTVLGLLEPSQLGVTLPHEHLLIDFTCMFREPEDPEGKRLSREVLSLENVGWVRYHWNSSLDNLVITDEAVVISETQRFVRAGGSAIVDATSIGINRDPFALARIAKAAKVHLVMGAGYYVEATHPPDMDHWSVEDIAGWMVLDITEGVDGTGIKAGILGELGCTWPLTENERKVLQAAALAQRRTGVALLVHPGRHEKAPMEILTILRDAGADLDRTIMSHIDRTVFDIEQLKEIAATGCYLEYDQFGIESSYYPLNPMLDMLNDAQRMDYIPQLIAEGLVKQVLLAQDIYAKHRMANYGGHGYDHLLTNIVPRMKLREIKEEDIQTMLVENPRRVLAFA